jgi:thiamine-monophosphate kinase
LTTVSSLGERALIRRITARFSMPSWVAVGPGDDAAVVAPRPRTHDVFTTDALVDGVHMDRRFVPPDAIGHRALAVNLSDLAAMGAEPRAALLSLILPDSLDVTEIDGMVGGMLALANEHGVAMVGGNITSTPGPLVVDITAIGSVHPRRALLRSGARPGDEVYVTGTLCDAAVGLRILRSDRAERSAQENVSNDPNDPNVPAAGAIARYLYPQPRVRVGLLLGRNGVASSCIDLSDGLADGVRQIAEASGVGITIDASSIPLSDEVLGWHARNGANPVDLALGGGDDYELMFTVRPAHRGRLRGVRNRLGTLPLTRIGVVTKGRGVLIQQNGTARPLPAGYEHFR